MQTDVERTLRIVNYTYAALTIALIPLDIILIINNCENSSLSENWGFHGLIFHTLYLCAEICHLSRKKFMTSEYGKMVQQRGENSFRVLGLIGGWVLVILGALKLAKYEHFCGTIGVQIIFNIAYSCQCVLSGVNCVAICIFISLLCCMACHQKDPQLEGISLAEVSAAIKTKPFLEWEKIADNTCAICLAPYKKDDNVARLNCKHYYHVSCLTDWLKISRICPYCCQEVVLKA